MPLALSKVRWEADADVNAGHLEHGHLQDLSKRYESFLVDEQAFRDAVELACGDPQKLSTTLLKHKLQKLKES